MIKRTFITLILSSFISLPLSMLAQEFSVYVSDAGNFNNPPWQILKFDQNGENPEVFISSDVAWPQDILFLEDQGVVLVTNLNSGKISRYHAETGAYIDDFATGIGGPTRMKIGADGLLYVLQWSGTGPVLRYELDGTFVDEYTDTGVNQAIGLDWDASGSLYVSSYTPGRVRQFDGTGTELPQFISTDLAGPTNIHFRENGDLMVLDYNGGTVDLFDADGLFIGSFISGLSQPEGLAILPNGDYLIGNGGDGSVRQYTPDGVLVGNFIEPGLGNLLTTNAVVIRYELSSNIEELGVDQIGIVQRGARFFLESEIELEFDSILIHDQIGREVHSSERNGDLVWTPQGHKAGVYQVSFLRGREVVGQGRVFLQKGE